MLINTYWHCCTATTWDLWADCPKKWIGIQERYQHCAGVIDSDYTSELKALPVNHSDTPFKVKTGDHIAQLIVERYLVTLPTEVDTLLETT
jgi:dUTP pyrophosphatase